MHVPQEDRQDELPALKSRTLGKYQLVARLGQGGMATVYLALAAGPAGFSKLMVLKILREDGPSELAELRQMFAEEARLAARFQHRNIVHTYEVCEIDGATMMTMEFLDGQTYRRLQARAARSEPLPLLEQLRILIETAHGLHYVHTLTDFDDAPLGTVHCDVSPQNVFVGYDGQVKLLDFGIAQTRDSSHQTVVEGFKGKLDYVAPEQLQGEPVDARTDVFALGVMLWEAIANARFGGGRAVESVAKVQARLRGAEPRIRELVPAVPEALAAIVEQAIAVDPALRFQDAAAFAGALEDYLDLLGARPSARSLARLVTPLFVRERAELRGLIERQVQTNRARQSLLAGDSGFGFDLTRSGTIALGEQTASTVTTLPPGAELVTALATLPPTDSQAPLAQAAKKRGSLRWLVALGVVAGGLLGLLDGEVTLPPAAAVDEPGALQNEPQVLRRGAAAPMELAPRPLLPPLPLAPADDVSSAVAPAADMEPPAAPLLAAAHAEPLLRWSPQRRPFRRPRPSAPVPLIAQAEALSPVEPALLREPTSKEQPVAASVPAQPETVRPTIERNPYLAQ